MSGKKPIRTNIKNAPSGCQQRMCSKIGSEGCSAKPSLFGDERGNHENEELDKIKHEDFRDAQQYLKDKSIENGRVSFKIRSQMLENMPGNFKNKFRYQKEN